MYSFIVFLSLGGGQKGFFETDWIHYVFLFISSSSVTFDALDFFECEMYQVLTGAVFKPG
jgi:hypothetical protein